MNPVAIPSIESVNRLFQELSDLKNQFHGSPLRQENPGRVTRTRIRQAIPTETGVAATAREVGGVSTLFGIQFVEREYVSDTTYKWVLLDEEALCFNDTIEDVDNNGTIIDVIRDADTNHYKMVVWVCE